LSTYWDQKFFESTRGLLVTLLRRGGRTVEELAQALNLTDNGVRAHLATLERDAIVRQRGSVRRGSGGKPAYVYELTLEAEELFPKAYEPVLSQLLDVLARHLGAQKSEALLRSVGRRIAEGQTVPADGVRGRLEAAADVLNELGGLAELEERNGSFVIRGYSCPLAGVVADHPQVCQMAETLLTELAGVPVYERCERGERGERPRCCFEIAPADGTKRDDVYR
jgi:predicted ArsR family transcriptional regulator